MSTSSKYSKQSKHGTDDGLKRLFLFILSQATIITTDYRCAFFIQLLISSAPKYNSKW